MDAMLGMVFMIPWSWAPAQYQRCAGQQLTIQQYAALYSLMGIAYGGNASTNFNLPNMQCRMPIGYGQAITSFGAVQLTVGASGGNFLTSLGMNNLPAHVHPATFAGGGSNPSTLTGTASLPVNAPATLSVTATGNLNIGNNALTGSVTPTAGALLGKGGGQANIYATGTPNTTIGPTQTFTGSAIGTVTGTASGPVTLTGNVAASGSVAVGANPTTNTPLNTVSPYLALNFIICTDGLYPMRN